MSNSRARHLAHPLSISHSEGIADDHVLVVGAVVAIVLVLVVLVVVVVMLLPVVCHGFLPFDIHLLARKPLKLPQMSNTAC